MVLRYKFEDEDDEEDEKTYNNEKDKV